MTLLRTPVIPDLISDMEQRYHRADEYWPIGGYVGDGPDPIHVRYPSQGEDAVLLMPTSLPPLSIPHQSSRFVVYAMFGRYGVPLYVGQTGNLTRRMRQHRDANPWLVLATRRLAIVGAAETRAEIERLEAACIYAMRPRANKINNLRGRAAA